jgi:hypothetical protein
LNILGQITIIYTAKQTHSITFFWNPTFRSVKANVFQRTDEFSRRMQFSSFLLINKTKFFFGEIYSHSWTVFNTNSLFTEIETMKTKNIYVDFYVLQTNTYYLILSSITSDVIIQKNLYLRWILEKLIDRQNILIDIW